MYLCLFALFPFGIPQVTLKIRGNDPNFEETKKHQSN